MIKLPLDRDRIRTILREAYENCRDILMTEEKDLFDIDCETFVSKIDPFIDSNRISTVVPLRLPSKKYPELVIEVNLQKKKLIARVTNDNIRIHLNRFLTKL